MRTSQPSAPMPQQGPTTLTRGGWFAVAGGIVVLALGLIAHERLGTAVSAGARPTLHSHAAQAAAGPSTVSATSLSAAGDAPAQPPDGLTAAQWQALQSELADHPDRDREIARVAAYLRYRAAVQRFTAMRDAGGDPGQRLQAAREVDTGLDERLARGELSAPEGLLLKMATTQVLHADPSVQQATVARWRASVAARVAPATDPRQAAFRQQEAALLAQYRALPPAQRDPVRLNEALQALRVMTFDSAPAASPAP